MKILVSNDDGVMAPGLRVLAEHLRKVGDVTVVAPMEEKSTMGHSLTIHKPLRIRELPEFGKNYYSVSGSPADCVYIGIREIIGKMPDLVVSGPNRGGNLGQDVYYSGTVSAAREACILGIPALAVSVDVPHPKRGKEIKVHYDTASKYMVKFIKRFDVRRLPKHTLLNFNIPNVPLNRVKGEQITRQGFRHYSGEVVKRIDHRGKPYFWVGGQYKGFEKIEGTDATCVSKNIVSITPLQLDCTNHRFLEELLATGL